MTYVSPLPYPRTGGTTGHHHRPLSHLPHTIMRITRMRLFGLGALVLALLAPAASAASAFQQMQDAAAATLNSGTQAAESVTGSAAAGLNMGDCTCGGGMGACVGLGLGLASSIQGDGRGHPSLCMHAGMRAVVVAIGCFDRSTKRPTDTIHPFPCMHTHTTVMAPAGSAAQVAFLQQVQKTKAVDPSAVFDAAVKSKAFNKVGAVACERAPSLCRVVMHCMYRLRSVHRSAAAQHTHTHTHTHTHSRQILENVEIQHRILENMPALKALSGFTEAHGRRLSDAEVSEWARACVRACVRAWVGGWVGGWARRMTVNQIERGGGRGGEGCDQISQHSWDAQSCL